MLHTGKVPNISTSQTMEREAGPMLDMHKQREISFPRMRALLDVNGNMSCPCMQHMARPLQWEPPSIPAGQAHVNVGVSSTSPSMTACSQEHTSLVLILAIVFVLILVFTIPSAPLFSLVILFYVLLNKSSPRLLLALFALALGCATLLCTIIPSLFMTLSMLLILPFLLPFRTLLSLLLLMVLAAWQISILLPIWRPTITRAHMSRFFGHSGAAGLATEARLAGEESRTLYRSSGITKKINWGPLKRGQVSAGTLTKELTAN
jgi:hypothetical protein